jgi:ElaA protein
MSDALPLRWVAFDELSVWELYEALGLRQQVFVVEQNCPYLDVDGHDPVSIHGLGLEAGNLVSYARIVPAGIAFPCVSIGRVVTAPSERGRGLGRITMVNALQEVERRFPKAPVTISAQCYLVAFYQSLGFETVGAPFDLDGIEHVKMHLTQRSKYTRNRR